MKKAIGILILTFISQFVFATPDDGVVEHESLLGYNTESFYSVKVISYPTGTYYAQFDSAFVIERAFKTGIIKSKQFINTRHHKDSTALGDWYTSITENQEFDFVRFMDENNIKYLYPNITRHSTDFVAGFIIDSDGMKLKFKKGIDLISPMDVLEKHNAWIKDYLEMQEIRNAKYPNWKKAEYVRVRDFILSDDYLFVIVSGDNEPERFETIFAIERNKFDNIIEKNSGN